MSTVIPFKINSSDKLYYNMKDLVSLSPEYFYGCKTRPRTIIKKKNIPNSEYVYANLKKNEWNLTTEDCKKAQLLVTKEWIDKYFFTTIKKNNIENTNDINENENLNNENEIENNDPISDFSIENAPSELYLDDSEKFRNINGEILNIETRGEKSKNNIYFKVKDVMNKFNLQSLDTVLLDTRYCYKRNIHYKTFYIRDTFVKHDLPTIKKSLYLTYKGMLKVLFTSRTENADLFQDWAEEKLFTIQMGSNEDKQKLGTQLLKVDLKTFKAVFDCYSSTFPCIYLLSLGKVKDLRETFKISDKTDDNLTVYKYGFTEDLERRLREHTNDYGKMKNVNVTLSIFHMIDVKYISKAENDIKHLFDVFDKSLQVNSNEQSLMKKRKELVILNDKEYKQITEHYKLIGLKYIGSTQYLQDKVQELQNEIKIINLNKEIEVQKLSNENEMLKKEIENEISKREIENEMLKREIENNKKIYELEKKTLELEIKLLNKNCN